MLAAKTRSHARLASPQPLSPPLQRHHRFPSSSSYHRYRPTAVAQAARDDELAEASGALSTAVGSVAGAALGAAVAAYSGGEFSLVGPALLACTGAAIGGLAGGELLSSRPDAHADGPAAAGAALGAAAGAVAGGLFGGKHDGGGALAARAGALVGGATGAALGAVVGEIARVAMSAHAEWAEEGGATEPTAEQLPEGERAGSELPHGRHHKAASSEVPRGAQGWGGGGGGEGDEEAQDRGRRGAAGWGEAAQPAARATPSQHEHEGGEFAPAAAAAVDEGDEPGGLPPPPSPETRAAVDRAHAEGRATASDASAHERKRGGRRHEQKSDSE